MRPEGRFSHEFLGEPAVAKEAATVRQPNIDAIFIILLSRINDVEHKNYWVMGKISRSPAFEAAFKADFTALYNASPRYGYYTRRDANSTALDPTYFRAQEESYAESFANYYSGKASWFLISQHY